MCPHFFNLHPLQIRLKYVVFEQWSACRWRMTDEGQKTQTVTWRQRQKRWCFISSWSIILCFYLRGERLYTQFITASFSCSRSSLQREWLYAHLHVENKLNNTLQLCEPVLVLPTCAAMAEREIFMRSGHLAKQKPLWPTGENETRFIVIIQLMNNVSIHKGRIQ